MEHKHKAKALIPLADDAIPLLCGKVLTVLITILNCFVKVKRCAVLFRN
jgi:hypothetical protein